MIEVPRKPDGTLAGYCHVCLGECAAAMHRLGYVWRLDGLEKVA